MARPPIVWTDEMLEDFIASYPVMPNTELAERFKVSLNTIRRKAKELSLAKSPMSEFRQQTIEAVRRMYGKHTAKEIAKDTGVSLRTIYRICHLLQLRMSKEEKSVIYSEAAKRMIRHEHSRRAFGLEPDTLRLLGRDKWRKNTINELKKNGYIVIKGRSEIYYGDTTTRCITLEDTAKSHGLRIAQWH